MSNERRKYTKHGTEGAKNLQKAIDALSNLLGLGEKGGTNVLPMEDRKVVYENMLLPLQEISKLFHAEETNARD